MRAQAYHCAHTRRTVDDAREMFSVPSAIARHNRARQMFGAALRVEPLLLFALPRNRPYAPGSIAGPSACCIRDDCRSVMICLAYYSPLISAHRNFLVAFNLIKPPGLSAYLAAVFNLDAVVQLYIITRTSICGSASSAQAYRLIHRNSMLPYNVKTDSLAHCILFLLFH